MITIELTEHDLTAPTPPPALTAYMDQQQARVDAATGGEGNE